MLSIRLWDTINITFSTDRPFTITKKFYNLHTTQNSPPQSFEISKTLVLLDAFGQNIEYHFFLNRQNTFMKRIVRTDDSQEKKKIFSCFSLPVNLNTLCIGGARL